MASIWDILEIEETRDKNSIKNAYRRKLTRTNPEDYPEEFKELRVAYEQAIAAAGSVDADGEPPGGAAETNQGLIKDESPVGLWLEKVEELYASFYDRIDVHQWERLLADDVCVGLESAEEARIQLLKVFMDHIKQPNNIWKAIDRVFDIT